jgi:Nucleotidyl transferase AbiEii toxin, Type IV TA system
MTELYWKTISPVMRDILASFGQSRLSGDFYLGGGTALALQLGHRLSADLDFFSPTQEISSLVEPLRAAFQPFSTTLASIAWSFSIVPNRRHPFRSWKRSNGKLLKPGSANRRAKSGKAGWNNTRQNDRIIQVTLIWR